MKQDLDQVMAEREIDAAVVTGGVHNNPAMHYLTNGAHLTGGIVVKRRGYDPVLIHHAMERGEAAKSGLATLDFVHFDYRGLIQGSETMLEARVELFRRVFDELDVVGRIGFYGMAEQGASYVLLKALGQAMPDATIVGEWVNDIFDVARATKGPEELERMRRNGQATATVMGEIISFIRDHQVVHRTRNGQEVGMLVRSDGKPLTVGDVKQYGRGRLFFYGLEDSEGMIFSIGRDAGVPHSRGEENDPLTLGESIVFDLYPREMGGGCFHDMTRTFCLGYAPPKVQKVFNDVRECFDRLMAALEPGAPTRRYEEMACDIFESQGHNTHRTNGALQEGYVHSLGHGVGLKLHERPAFSLSPDNSDILQPGSVFTLEPGLYYPEEGFGVRLEDTVYLDEKGQFHSLTDFDKELVIEL